MNVELAPAGGVLEHEAVEAPKTALFTWIELATSATLVGEELFDLASEHAFEESDHHGTGTHTVRSFSMETRT